MWCLIGNKLLQIAIIGKKKCKGEIQGVMRTNNKILYPCLRVQGRVSEEVKFNLEFKR